MRLCYFTAASWDLQGRLALRHDKGRTTSFFDRPPKMHQPSSGSDVNSRDSCSDALQPRREFRSFTNMMLWTMRHIQDKVLNSIGFGEISRHKHFLRSFEVLGNGGQQNICTPSTCTTRRYNTVVHVRFPSSTGQRKNRFRSTKRGCVTITTNPLTAVP